MKPNCILCGSQLIDTKERYSQYGNFCIPCTNEISFLSHLYPGDSPPSGDGVYKLNEFTQSQEYYEKKSKNFQMN